MFTVVSSLQGILGCYADGHEAIKRADKAKHGRTTIKVYQYGIVVYEV